MPAYCCDPSRVDLKECPNRGYRFAQPPAISLEPSGFPLSRVTAGPLTRCGRPSGLPLDRVAPGFTGTPLRVPSEPSRSWTTDTMWPPLRVPFWQDGRGDYTCRKGLMTNSRIAEVEHWLKLLYIAAADADLRAEDRRKAIEMAGMLDEIERAARRISSRSRLLLVDAAAGKTYVGLLAAKLVFEPMGRQAGGGDHRAGPKAHGTKPAGRSRLQSTIPIECRTADVSSVEAWPVKPSIVAALHACGSAADAIIERSIAGEAGTLLLAPCCTGKSIPAAEAAARRAELAGIPRQAPVPRRFIQAMVDAERTWRLEAAGYETEVIEFVGATVTPHNLLWRARRVQEPVRMAAARLALGEMGQTP